MRISASGLESTIAVAIDQIFRLAPSIRPPIDPVVSSTNATSTVGLAMACDRPADRGRVASSEGEGASVGVAKRCFMVSSSSVMSLGTQRFPRLRGGVWSEIKAGYGTNLRPVRPNDERPGPVPDRAGCASGRKSAKLGGMESPARQISLVPAAGPPPVGDRAGDRARHRADVAIAGFFLHQRTAAAVGAARRSGGAERKGRDLDRRDQILGGGPSRRPEMAGLPDALRPAVLRLHAGSAVRDLSRPTPA